jgi:hypothetical protein
MKDSEYIQEPQHNADYHNSVEYGFDTSGHGNETIYQPEQESNYDQGQ